jgi:dinuclear metal center YbgI/SA1388 family protein
MTTSRSKIKRFLTDLLRPFEFSDYCPNGLQIEGSEEISKIAFAVSAQRDSINKAIEAGCDTMIVHHGLFWKFHGTRPLTGSFGKRVMPLVRNNINLFGYHLPLDAHIEHGNAASIAKAIGLEDLEPFGDYKGSPTGVKGKFKKEIAAKDLRDTLEKVLKHSVIHSDPQTEKIKSMGIITGGANGDWNQCIYHGLDAYLTGEISEHDWHEAKEEGIHMFAGGHNATEKFGVLALQELIEKEFNVETLFIDSNNPA